MRAVNRTRNIVLVDAGDIAASMWTRLRGLLGHAPLKTGEGMLLRGEKAIHTVGMRFPIDVLFLDKAGRVVHVIPEMRAYRFSPFVARATDVLEMPVGVIAQSGTTLGDQIDFTFAS